MKLYIQQKVFSWRDKFAVKDEEQNDRWYAQSDILTFGRELRVYDSGGNEAAFIRQKVFSFLHKYYIQIGGEEYELVREFTFFKPRYSIRELDLTVEGNLFEHEYSVANSQGELMRITKAWLTWGDYYELDIYDAQNELFCLCIALAIDCINADSRN